MEQSRHITGMYNHTTTERRIQMRVLIREDLFSCDAKFDSVRLDGRVFGSRYEEKIECVSDATFRNDPHRGQLPQMRGASWPRVSMTVRNRDSHLEYTALTLAATRKRQRGLKMSQGWQVGKITRIWPGLFIRMEASVMITYYKVLCQIEPTERALFHLCRRCKLIFIRDP